MPHPAPPAVLKESAARFLDRALTAVVMETNTGSTGRRPDEPEARSNAFDERLAEALILGAATISSG